MEELNKYVIEKIKLIQEEIRTLQKNIKHAEEMLEYEEEKIEESVQKMKKKLQKEGKSEEYIKEMVLMRYDSAEDWLDDVRAEITKKRERLFALENDLIIFENYGR